MSFDNPRMLFKVSQDDPNLEYEKNLYRTLTVEESEAESYVTNEGWFTHPYLALEAYNNSLTAVVEPVVTEELGLAEGSNLTGEPETPADPEVTTVTTRSRK